MINDIDPIYVNYLTSRYLSTFLGGIIIQGKLDKDIFFIYIYCACFYYKFIYLNT